MAAETGNVGWSCPRCGCSAWRVVNSYLINGRRRRQRACLNCHMPIQTYEIPCPKGYDVVLVKKSTTGGKGA